ncbi:hypothetical protein [Fodinibius sediminis]|uniref:Uncharacterized protein n=1 Tax=Fodinibius sediminis TaxID=1214077 RepID=A0A521CVN3_9BACT|nr:hypothetical protein [Fodinibius sediminis]SMO63488.1 hypothetical protein SAMN06265218_107152 [Fodinibius sediminis]
MSSEKRDRDNVFHERISILKEQGYCGFMIDNIKKHWDGIQVTVRNNSGETITASGETPEEAYSEIIDSIDLMTDM